MRHITQIRIRGFQSHEDSTIRLHPGLNAITGQSDSGKSAVLRALAWWAWNVTPSGDWIRQGHTLAQVEVTLSDGAVITRERRSGRNSYTIRLPGMEPMVLADFGKKVPDEVLRAHGMVPVAFNPEKPSILNWASQLESPFFLTETEGMRARIIGRLAGVHVIDHAIGEIKRDILAIGKETKQQETEVSRLESQLSVYVGLDDEAVRVERAEELLGRLERTDARLDKVRSLAAQFQSVQNSMATARAVLDRLQFVDLAAALLTTAVEAHQRSMTLRTARQRLTAHGQEMEAATGIMQRLAQVPAMEAALLRAEVAETRRLQLTRVANTYLENGTAMRLTATILDRTKRAQEAQDALERLGVAVDTLNRLRALRGSLEGVQRSIQDTGRVLIRASRQESAAAPLEALGAITGRLNGLRSIRARFAETQTRMEKGAGIIAGLKAQITIASQAYAEALQRAGVCPTCLQTIDPQTAARIAATITEEECTHVQHAS